ncbi:MAG: hypothetical protein KF705_13235 [Phycisphaeraceae bacterium]|nr:hypothetical protein [Phycisphaeraceae bacterium]
MVPESQPVQETPVSVRPESLGTGILDAAAIGASDGLKLALNVAAMLVAFVSLIALVNWPLNAIGTSLEQILGHALAPAAWLMSIDEGQRILVGSLLGKQIVATEFVAYVSLHQAMISGDRSSECPDRDVCIVRVLQPAIDRDTDWRADGSGTRTQGGFRLHRSPGHGRGGPGLLEHGLRCRALSLTTRSERRGRRGSLRYPL